MGDHFKACVVIGVVQGIVVRSQADHVVVQQYANIEWDMGVSAIRLLLLLLRAGAVHDGIVLGRVPHHASEPSKNLRLTYASRAHRLHVERKVPVGQGPRPLALEPKEALPN